MVPSASKPKILCFLFLYEIVLPPVLVPRQSEYPRPAPPLPAAFRAVEEPPMPYNASYPFTSRPSHAEHSPAHSFDVAGRCSFFFSTSLYLLRETALKVVHSASSSLKLFIESSNRRTWSFWRYIKHSCYRVLNRQTSQEYNTVCCWRMWITSNAMCLFEHDTKSQTRNVIISDSVPYSRRRCCMLIFL